MNGKLIVFEGVNEVGKSTLAASLYTNLFGRSIESELFAFPGNRVGTLGRHIYEMHHGAKRLGIDNINPTSLQLLHIAAHIDSVESLIIPALSKGKVVILDRFWWSTYVYGRATGANDKSLLQMIELECQHWGRWIPDIVFLVKREIPVTPLYDQADWDRIANLYEELANKETGKYPIERVRNDGPVDVAYTQVSRAVDLLLHG